MCYLTQTAMIISFLKKRCNKRQIQDSRLPIMAFLVPIWHPSTFPRHTPFITLWCKNFNVKQYKVNLALVKPSYTFISQKSQSTQEGLRYITTRAELSNVLIIKDNAKKIKSN